MVTYLRWLVSRWGGQWHHVGDWAGDVSELLLFFQYLQEYAFLYSDLKNMHLFCLDTWLNGKHKYSSFDISHFARLFFNNDF